MQSNSARNPESQPILARRRVFQSEPVVPQRHKIEGARNCDNRTR
jgi:hypothetical protein